MGTRSHPPIPSKEDIDVEGTGIDSLGSTWVDDENPRIRCETAANEAAMARLYDQGSDLVRVQRVRGGSNQAVKEGKRVQFRLWRTQADGEEQSTPRSSAREAWLQLLHLCTSRSTSKRGKRGEEVECEADVWDVELPAGLNEALMQMSEGEEADVELIGDVLLPDEPAQLPPGWTEKEMKVQFRLEVTQVMHGRGDKFQMSAQERWARAEVLRLVGNALVKEKRHKRAARVYQDATRFLNIMQAEGDEAHGGVDESARKENRQAMDLLAKLWLNYAHAALKEERWREADTACTEVIAIDPGNAKALYRRGVARSELQEWEEGEKDLKQALLLDPAVHSDVSKSMSRLKQLRREHNLKQMDRMAGMFDRLGDLYWDNENTKPQGQPDAKPTIPRKLSARVRRRMTPPLPDSDRVLSLKEALSAAEIRKEKNLTRKDSQSRSASPSDIIEDLDMEMRAIEEEEEEQNRLQRQEWLNECIRRKQTV